MSEEAKREGMKRRVTIRIASLICVITLFTFCDLNFDLDLPDPTLDITAQTVYDSATDISIQFSFTAEEDKHLCRYNLAKNNGAGYTVVEEGEEELVAGQVYERDYSPEGEGQYKFSFSVLVERNGSYETPPFLQDSIIFWVDSTPPSGLVSISVPSGSYNSAQDVVLDHIELVTIDGSPSRIFYTTDGNDPDPASTLYVPGEPVKITADCTLKAVAIDLADRRSDPNSATYIIDTQIPVLPVASPGSGTYSDNSVTLLHPEWPTSADGTPVKLYYTLDWPTMPFTEYTGTPISLSDGNKVIKAVAIDEAGNTSNELTESYVIDTVAPEDPSMDHSSNDYNSPFDLVITHSEIPIPSGTPVQIYYTVGPIDSPPADPDLGSTPYTASIPIDRNTIVKAIAIDEARNASTVVSRTFTSLRIDSIVPSSCSKTTSINTIDIGGFFFDKEAANIGIYISDVVTQQQCYLDAGVSSYSNLHVIILDTYIAGMAAGLGTLTVVNQNNGDSVSIPITINP